MTDPEKKLNILYVFGGEKAQGAEIVIERLIFYNSKNVNAHLILSPGKFADQLLSADKPYKITVINDLKKLNRSSSSKVGYYLKGIKNYFTISYKVNKYIKANKIDAVHANTMVIASYIMPLIIYSRLFKPRLIWYWSDHDLQYFNKLDISISEACNKLYDRTLLVSEALKAKFENKDKLVVLYNGLDTETFKPDSFKRANFRKKYDLADDLICIGLAASINPDKGQLELINVCNKLVKSHARIKLLIAGGFAADSPQYSATVKEAIEKSPVVFFMGYVDDMMAFYNGCDIIVNNSRHYRSEPLGTTIYEAMACEKIVLGSDTGGTPEIIDDKVDGYLFEAENEAELERALEYVIVNYQAQDQLRTSARKKVIRKFNIFTMMEKYNEIIQLPFKNIKT